MKRARAAVAAVLLAVPVAAAVQAGTAAPAAALDNGLARAPALGWSSWSFVRRNPTAAIVETTADAMVGSGLAAVGYRYVNLDDFWYVCPGSQGPDVDANGRWVTDTTKFPAGPDGENGIRVVADYVHAKGLRFGLYVTPGISHQAVVQNTPIEGTPYHAADIATTTAEKNYNCKGMVGIDYTKPGAQEFIDSWAAQFASWGVDYLKIDGVGVSDVPDIQAWSQALLHTGRPIHLELSNNLAISGAATWKQLANGWRTGGDVECYCGPGGASYPLTDWGHVSSRFNQVANWAPYGGPGGFNDYDSIEVGNGVHNGLTPDERRTQLSLWALAASPLILGTDLTALDPGDLELLTNRSVLAVDQDAIDATRIASSATTQVFAKREANGDAIVGLFNTGTSPAVVATTAAALGLPPAGGYLREDLWSHVFQESGGTIAADVAPHGVALYRLRPSRLAALAPPATTVDATGLGALAAGQPATVTVTFTNDGAHPVQLAELRLSTPDGWTVAPTGPVLFDTVGPGESVRATFAVTAPPPATLFESHPVTATVDYRWALLVPQRDAVTYQVSTSPPVAPPYRTFSSATDAPSAFAQLGTRLGVSGAGADLYSSSDAYSAVYLPGSVGATATVSTTVVSQQNMSGFAKAGIIVRNDMTGSGTTPEGVILFESPSGGIQLEWTRDGGTHINTVTPPNGTIPASLPVHLTLVRTATDSYAGYYSLDGQAWTLVGTATVPGQAGTQDAGVFVTSHASGSPGTVVFDGFAAAPGATPPPSGP
jgi:Alpha galactosidase A/NPCBM-associated, NEW3 domain of alpha-galactosidase/Alpha galactosidase C-terminal beta sandwich domain